MQSVIYGCASTELSHFEREFFAKEQPYGLILFARNCVSPDQVKALIAEFRAIVKRADAPILIDQEGGRVQRLKHPFAPLYPPANIFAKLYAKSLPDAKRATYLGMRLIGHDLHELGINVNCVPCADLYFDFAHKIIGDRSYGAKVKQVADLAEQAFEGLRDSGVAGVLKHIPGHGRALADSHEELPIVTTAIAELKRTDFAVFRALRDVEFEFAMTAHVVYSAIDSECATFSKKTQDKIIRRFCKFPMLVMSDDLSMKALSGSFASRVDKAYFAGCDIILHCNGQEVEMQEIATKTKPFMGDSKQLAQEAMQNVPYKAFDVAAARAEFSSLTGWSLT